MRFRLLYSGRLLGASRNDTRASLKHEIRCEIAPQLKRLWETNAHLIHLSRSFALRWQDQHPEARDILPQSQSEAEPILSGHGLQYLASNWERAGQGFIPLVTEDMGLRCKLDILFLRPELPGKVYHGGDLDNRIKTLFDALRVPKDGQEMGGATPESDPVYCLLSDDGLISELTVVADNLLLLPHEDKSTPNDVFLVVDVKLEAPVASKYGHIFG